MAQVHEIVQSIQNKLTPIRDIVIRLHSILIWQKPYHAPCIIAITTMIFMALWLVNIPILSKLSFIGIILTLLDYFLPFLNALIAFPKWEDKEKLFNSLCEDMAYKWLDLIAFYYLFSSWKTSNVKLYYSTLLTSLIVTAWIGFQVNNLLLLYLVTLFLVLYPGLSHYNMIEQFYHKIQKQAKTMFSSKPSKKFT